MTPARRLTAPSAVTRLTVALAGGSLLCAAAPAGVLPDSNIAFADAAAAAQGPTAAPDAAPAPPAADAAAADAPPDAPAPQPAAVAPSAAAAPAASPAAAAAYSGPPGGPAANWRADLPSSAPSAGPAGYGKGAQQQRSRPPAATEQRASSRPIGGACLRVDTTPSCPTRRRDTDGRRASDALASAATEAAAGSDPQPIPLAGATLPGLALTRVPNVFIDGFRIPAFLLSIYQAAGIQYGIRWEVLAAINEIETDYGRNLNVSSAGAMGWMQFIPSSWKTWGVDANSDGKKDPYNPVDSIFAAARYLKAAGADQDLRKAIFSYNHADWYVDSVLMRARFIGGMPADLIGALTGLSQGQLPVAAPARYGAPPARHGARGLDIRAAAGAPAVAVQDGEIVRVGHSSRLGRFVVLRDAYGNTYTYGRLKRVAMRVAVPKQTRQSAASIAQELALPAADPAPTEPASAGSNTGRRAQAAIVTAPRSAGAVAKERLFAHPGRPHALAAGGRRQILESWTPLPGSASLRSYLTGSYGLERRDVVLKRLLPGRKVIAGTILGRIGTNPSGRTPYMRFEIRPAGRGAPRIDPAPIVRGWRLLEATAMNRVADASLAAPSLGQILLMSKDALARRVLANPGIEIYACGRRDVEAGVVDRRVLATLEFLAASGLKPTVTSLRCGHSFHTAGGAASAHSAGAAVDIAKINGTPILGNQGPGSVADRTVRRLLALQGALEPAQIISLMSFEGAINTLALADHADHIHIGFGAPSSPLTTSGRVSAGALKPSQWTRLVNRLATIKSPTVRLRPSPYAINVVAPAPPERSGP